MNFKKSSTVYYVDKRLLRICEVEIEQVSLYGVLVRIKNESCSVSFSSIREGNLYLFDCIDKAEERFKEIQLSIINEEIKKKEQELKLLETFRLNLQNGEALNKTQIRKVKELKYV